MLGWLLGLEDSFAKSFLYVLYLFSGITFMFSALLLVFGAGPLLVNKLAVKFRR